MRSLARQWPQTKRVWRQFSQMDSVMERLGLDLNLAARKAGGAAMKEARDICLACPMQRRCREWLDGQTTLGEPNFCPNLIFFEQCGKV